MDWYKAYGEINRFNWMILGIFSFISLFKDLSFFIGVLLGGFAIILNFFLLQRTFKKIFQKRNKKLKKKVVIPMYYVRLLALGAFIYYMISSKCVNPIGLLLGLSVVVLSIVIFGIKTIFQIYSDGGKLRWRSTSSF